MKFLKQLGLLALVTLVLVLVGASSTLSVSPALAQTPTPTLVVEPNTPPNQYKLSQEQIDAYLEATQDCDSPSLECLVHNIYQFVMIETYSQAAGGAKKGGDNNQDASLLDQSQFAYGGAINGLYRLIGAMYTHPIASGRTYVADVAHSLNLAPPVYAQGVGFSSLNPILSIWKTFRNIAYLFFVVIFLVIGFMIMFRAKVGQAAVTAQQAIPSVIVSLILVTFSYAIAGFLIDFMYLLMVFLQKLFQISLEGKSAISMNFIDLVGVMFHGTTGIGDGVSGTVGSNIAEEFLKNLSLGTLLDSILDFLGGLTLTVVIAIAVLIASFKLFFELLRAYATAVIHIVLAPLELMIGAIPGQNVFVKWFKAIVGNLLPFPTVLFILILYAQFANYSIQNVSGGFIPPFLLGSGQGSIISYIMGLALILALPEIVKHVREGVGGKGGIGEMIASAAGGRAKEAWSGKGIAGVNAKRIMGAAGKGVGYGSLVGLGSTRGAIQALKAGPGVSIKDQAWKGAQLGFKVPYNINMVRSIAPKMWNEYKEQQGLEALSGTVDWAERKTQGNPSLNNVISAVGQRVAATRQAMQQRQHSSKQSSQNSDNQGGNNP